MFKIQREVYETYHVTDAGQFYDKADVWSVATEKYNNSDIEVEPYFNVMKIDENSNAHFIGIHQNKFEQSKYRGAQVFYANNQEAERLG